jgi:hypothetical protein
MDSHFHQGVLAKGHILESPTHIHGPVSHLHGHQQTNVSESFSYFLSSNQLVHDHTVRYAILLFTNIYFSRFSALGVAFGVAASVLIGAVGAAIKFVSSKVEEERAKNAKKE